MRDCPHCHHPLPKSLSECPECGSELESPGELTEAIAQGRTSHQPYVPIARFANVAEAGYFHCELEGQLECEVRLTAQNHFDASIATWWNNYVLSVPAGDAEHATSLLKKLVAETGQSDLMEYGNEPVIPCDRAADGLPVVESRIHWVPIILTLTAGTFVVWAAKQVHRHVRDPAGRGGGANQVDLWEQLSKEGRPWVQDVDGGHGRRELTIDRASRVATLREDTDGDGIFERKARISLAPASR